MNRSSVREITFKLLYSLEVQHEKTEDQIDLYIENEEIKDEDVKKYIKETVMGIEKNSEEITKLISENLKSDWEIERISKINLALLELAIYEINYAEIPYKVAINEVIELSKKYDEETAHQFINGVLASIVSKRGDNV